MSYSLEDMEIVPYLASGDTVVYQNVYFFFLGGGYLRGGYPFTPYTDQTSQDIAFRTVAAKPMV